MMDYTKLFTGQIYRGQVPLGTKFVQYDLSHHIKQKKMINQRKAVELCKKV